MTEVPPPKKSDLGVRAASAVVMVAVAGTALWLGGWVWTAFVALVALGVLWEWSRLARAIANSPVAVVLWLLGGAIYIGLGATILASLRMMPQDPGAVLMVAGSVIATDIGAYFAGRTFGGPKIAPAISPSKTWSGLAGGVLGASLVVMLMMSTVCYDGPEALFAYWRACLVESFRHFDILMCLPIGALIAITAQAGDFFESWMKRRAGVKDSGNLIPGHGGLYDRVDGLLAVCFVLGLFLLPGLLSGQ